MFSHRVWTRARHTQTASARAGAPVRPVRQKTVVVAGNLTGHDKRLGHGSEQL